MSEHTDDESYRTKQKNRAGEACRQLQEEWSHAVAPDEFPSLKLGTPALGALLGDCHADTEQQIVRLFRGAGNGPQRGEDAQHAALGLKVTGTPCATLDVLGNALHLAAGKAAIEILREAGANRGAAGGNDFGEDGEHYASSP
jgi:hypothetical protein